jgi:hypothetical protein
LQPYYQDELVTLYHGNCLEIDAWLKADVLVTDPPYGVNNESRGTYDARKGEHSARRVNPIASDKTTAARDSAISLWGDKPRIVFGTWKRPRPDPVDHRLIWHKKKQPPGPARCAFMLQDEEIYVTGKGFRKSSPPMRSVIPTEEIRHGKYGLVATIGHPTPKPIDLMELLIDRCPPGVIADPFAGSGSTLVAASNLGRKSVGIELEERYCELIAKRLSQGTQNLLQRVTRDVS